MQGGDLVTQRLAATGRHQDKRILTIDQAFDDRFLVCTEFGVAKHLLQGLTGVN